MSIIAVKRYEDHVEIAADTQITHDMSRIQNMVGFKLVRYGDIVLGQVGDATIPTFLRLYMKDVAFPEVTLEGVSSFIVSFYDFVDKVTPSDYDVGASAFIFAAHDRVIAAEDYYVIEVDDYYSVGAGVDLSDAQMRNGKTPLEAANEICKWNIFCSKPIEEYKLYEDRIDYYVDK